MKAKLRKSEHQFKIGEKIKRVEAGQKFEEVSLGSLLLQAGPQEIIVTLPPGGSIDYISLSAPNSAMIIPADG
ncbi:MAG: hypothetical protein GWO08_17560, partial [Gammaproteobacteria bacterium]|nr:hypothetical protein [Gammaproteobacteria bacterium]NIR95384.1 hypothetical protein [Gammaproteobacteria bacterium]